MNSGVPLPNHRSLHDAGIYKNGAVLYLEIKGLPSSNSSSGTSTTTASNSHSGGRNHLNTSIVVDLSTLKSTNENDICISKATFDKTPKLCKSIIKQCRIALAYGIKPVLVLDGSGGTYFLHDVHKRKIAVFKPADEEPYAVNNPRGYVKSGNHVGMGSLYLDSGSGSGNGNGYDNEHKSNSNSNGYYDDDDDDYYDDTMSMRAGIKPGEACLREVAAYLLDESGFSGVPMTTLVEARHPAFHSNGSMLKLNQGGASVGSHSHSFASSSSNANVLGSVSTTTSTSTPSVTTSSVSSYSTYSGSASGSSSTSPATAQPRRTSLTATATTTSPKLMKKVGSCQEFIPSECSMDDLSPSKISAEEIHKIAILDIRILNADRNTANLLCRRKPEKPDTFELIPIDHGYCLRTVADVCWFDWCWLDWPQTKEPLSDRMREYVLGLDIERDVQMLKERLDIPQKALDYFRASSTLLQRGVRAGLTLYEIAVLCCRNDDAGEQPSKLESILSMAGDIASSAVDNGRWHHAAASRALEQQLSPDNGYVSSRPGAKAVGVASGGRRGSYTMNIFKSASSVNFSSFMNSSSTSSTLLSADDCDYDGDNGLLSGVGDGNGDLVVRRASSSIEASGRDGSNQDQDQDILLPHSHSTPPVPMAQSSGSDSSSDGGAAEEKEQEEQECEQWAADFIAGTLDYAAPISIPKSTRSRQRSISFADSGSSSSDDSSSSDSDSDDSSELSKSPVGFWFVPPSASKVHNSRLAEEDTVWTPEVSPASSQRNITEFDLNRAGRSVKFHDTVLAPKQLVNSKMSSLSNGESANDHLHSHVRLDGDNNSNSSSINSRPTLLIKGDCVNDDIDHDGDDEKDETTEHPSNSKNDIPDLPPRGPGLMKRSQSYSAFSFKRITDGDGKPGASTAARASPTTTSSDEYEKYYQKFISLLIDRETAPIINNRKNHKTKSSKKNNNPPLSPSSSEKKLGIHFINEQ